MAIPANDSPDDPEEIEVLLPESESVPSSISGVKSSEKFFPVSSRSSLCGFLLQMTISAFVYLVAIADLITDCILAEHYRRRSDYIRDDRCLLYLDANQTIQTISPEDLRHKRSTDAEEFNEPLLDYSLFFHLTVFFIFLPWISRMFQYSCKELLWQYVLHNNELIVNYEDPLQPEWVDKLLTDDTLLSFFVCGIIKLVMLPLLPGLILIAQLREFKIRFRLYEIETKMKLNNPKNCELKSLSDGISRRLSSFNTAESSENERYDGNKTKTETEIKVISEKIEVKVEKNHKVTFNDDEEKQMKPKGEESFHPRLNCCSKESIKIKDPIQLALKEVSEDRSYKPSEICQLVDELVRLSEYRFHEAFLESAPQFVLQMVWRILDGVMMDGLWATSMITSFLNLCFVVWNYVNDAIKNNPIRRNLTGWAMTLLFFEKAPSFFSRLLFYSILFGSTSKKWRLLGGALVLFHTLFGGFFELLFAKFRTENRKAKVSKFSCFLKYLKLTLNCLFRGFISNITLLLFRLKHYDSKKKTWLDEADTETLATDPPIRFYLQTVFYILVISIHSTVAYYWYEDDSPSCLLDDRFSELRLPILGVILAGPLISIMFLFLYWKVKDKSMFSTLGRKAINGLYFYLEKSLRKNDAVIVENCIKRLKDEEKRYILTFRDHNSRTLVDNLNESEVTNFDKISIAVTFLNHGLNFIDFVDLFVNSGIKSESDESTISRVVWILEKYGNTMYVRNDCEETFLFRCFQDAKDHNQAALKVLKKISKSHIPLALIPLKNSINNEKEVWSGTTSPIVFFHGDKIKIIGGSIQVQDKDNTERGFNYPEPNILWSFCPKERKFYRQETVGDVPQKSRAAASGIISETNDNITKYYLIAFGGWLSENNVSNEVYSLDLETLVWKNLKVDPSVPSQIKPAMLDRHAGWVIGSDFYSFGGWSYQKHEINHSEPSSELTKNIDLSKIKETEDNLTTQNDDASMDKKRKRKKSRTSSNGNSEPVPNYTVHSKNGMSNNIIIRFNRPLLENRNWEHIPVTGSVPLPRHRVAHCLTKKGDFYMYGGMRGNDRSSELFRFSPTVSKWTKVKFISQDIPPPLSDATLSSLTPYRFLLCGGGTVKQTLQRRSWIIDVKEGRSSDELLATVKPLLTMLPSLDAENKGQGIWRHRDVLWVEGEKVFLIGGDQNEKKVCDFIVEMEVSHLMD